MIDSGNSCLSRQGFFLLKKGAASKKTGFGWPLGWPGSYTLHTKVVSFISKEGE